MSASVLKMHKAAPSNADLPDPFSQVQRKAMAQDLAAALKECTTTEEMHAASLHVVSVWTCRAARRYASDLVAQLQDLVIERIHALEKTNEDLKRGLESEQHARRLAQLELQAMRSEFGQWHDLLRRLSLLNEPH